MRETFLHITRECNNDCVFCGFPRAEESLPYEQVMHKIIMARDSGCKLITLTGGEPLMHSKLVDIVKFISSCGIESRITSNMTKATPLLLSKLIDAGLRYIAVSVHSLSADTAKSISRNKDYDVDTVMDSISYLLSKRFPVYWNTTIFRENHKELPAIAERITTAFPSIHLVNFNYVNFQGNALKPSYDTMVPVSLQEVEPYLDRAMKMMSKAGINFRVERVPLCYMQNFKEFSSEYNRILAIEEPNVEMIDGMSVKAKDFFKEYTKTHSCKLCSLNDHCMGAHDNYVKKYGTKELYPVFWTK